MPFIKIKINKNTSKWFDLCTSILWRNINSIFWLYLYMMLKYSAKCSKTYFSQIYSFLLNKTTNNSNPFESHVVLYFNLSQNLKNILISGFCHFNVRLLWARTLIAPHVNKRSFSNKYIFNHLLDTCLHTHYHHHHRHIHITVIVQCFRVRNA